ncbi:hypothetical protein PU560_01115, partial [Georgenia sp. 10Sc9-8]|nr:hypothetical protein [Georgenia halotolerans]
MAEPSTPGSPHPAPTEGAWSRPQATDDDAQSPGERGRRGSVEARAIGELQLGGPGESRPASPASPTGDSPAAVPTAYSASAVP